MTRSTWWCCGLGVSLFWGCLLPDVGIDDSLGEEGTAGTAATDVRQLQAGAGGSAGTGPMMPPSASSGSSGSGGSSGSSSNAGTGGGSGSGATAGAGGGAACVLMAPDVNNYNPDREKACLDYCTLYTCVCAGHPDNSYTDAFDCINTCIDSVWPIGTLSTIVPGTVSCRFWHAGLAVSQGVTPHCSHAAEVPSQGGCQVMP